MGSELAVANPLAARRSNFVPVTGGARRRPAILGVLNVTPDSFSDGGRYSDLDAAIAHGIVLAESGADIIDVGGESTRPGADRVGGGEERERVIPVIRALAESGLVTSIDTMDSVTAAAAVEAGAELVNDVSGGLADPEMYRVVADTGVHYIAMHWRGHSDTMAELADYDDVVQEVRDELKARIAELIVWGVGPDRVILDPGIGFAKSSEHNWRLLGHLEQLTTLGYPVLVGASRKRFLGELLPDDASPLDRDPATATISTLAAQAGAWGVRVHDVASTKAALEVWSAWEHGSVS